MAENECDAAFISFNSACSNFIAASEASVVPLQKLAAAQAHLDEVSGIGEERGGWTDVNDEEY